ncbi:HupE/UreJ family protein [Shewanella sp. YIC-542]|uniref:HupE/UreJ family protein n=1 Tax=Shewanella mytili TaxID=3377111 RepID=UPI00398F20FE
MLSISFPVVAKAMGGSDGFSYGLQHSFQGIDHILIAFSVGLFCTLLERGFFCLIPTAFLFFMSLGGVVGVLDVPFFSGDLVLAFGVLALGGIIALNRKMPVSFAMAIVGIFALFYGHEHGRMMPEGALPFAYLAGLFAGALILQSLGIFTGRLLIGIDRSKRLLQSGGWLIALFGGYLVLGFSA